MGWQRLRGGEVRREIGDGRAGWLGGGGEGREKIEGPRAHEDKGEEGGSVNNSEIDRRRESRMDLSHRNIATAR